MQGKRSFSCEKSIVNHENDRLMRFQFTVRSALVLLTLVATMLAISSPLIRFLLAPRVENVVGRDWLPNGYTPGGDGRPGP